jgi:FKBP-type peptidyl-prolyl cis-trans isomerase
MAGKRERIVAAAGALLFLGTSVSATIAFVWQMHQSQAQSQEAQITNSQEEKVYGQIADYTPVDKVETLQKIDTVEGTGDEVKTSDTVTVKYTGAYASDGQIFDSSDVHGGQPISFPLNGVIQGWTEGMPGMKAGGKRRLMIPAAMAYGANPPAGIRANADMVFDVELIKIGG